jgi:hypothetical protein
MKNITSKLAVIATTVIITLALMPSRSHSEPGRSRNRQVVALWAEQAGFSKDGVYHYTGADIYCSSSSAGAPQFPQLVVQAPVALTNLADGVAMLLDEGFTLQGQGVFGQYFLFIK